MNISGPEERDYYGRPPAPRRSRSPRGHYQERPPPRGLSDAEHYRYYRHEIPQRVNNSTHPADRYPNPRLRPPFSAYPQGRRSGVYSTDLGAYPQGRRSGVYNTDLGPPNISQSLRTRPQQPGTSRRPTDFTGPRSDNLAQNQAPGPAQPRQAEGIAGVTERHEWRHEWRRQRPPEQRKPSPLTAVEDRNRGREDRKKHRRHRKKTLREMCQSSNGPVPSSSTEWSKKDQRSLPTLPGRGRDTSPSRTGPSTLTLPAPTPSALYANVASAPSTRRTTRRRLPQSNSGPVNLTSSALQRHNENLHRLTPPQLSPLIQDDSAKPSGLQSRTQSKSRKESVASEAGSKCSILVENWGEDFVSW